MVPAFALLRRRKSKLSYGCSQETKVALSELNRAELNSRLRATTSSGQSGFCLEQNENRDANARVQQIE